MVTQRFVVGAAMALIALVVQPAAADSKEALKLGLEALESNRWADAERFFRAAIAERSEERVNRLRRIDYLPHYYLGIALSEQGQCRTALGSWSESQRQGEVQKSKLISDLNLRIERCQSQLRQVANAADEVDELVASVSAAADSLATLGQTPELAPRWSAGDHSFASRQQAASESLEAAKQRLEHGRAKDDLKLLDEARLLADQSLAQFEDTLVMARRSLGELNAATASALEQLEQAEESARRVLRSIRDLAPYSRTLGLQVATVERNLKEIEVSKSGAGANRLATLRDELTVSLAGLRRAARRPPESLTQAVEAFFSGNYATVLELTEEVAYSRDSRSRSHRCLLRGASQHALWILGGEEDETLRDLACQEIRICVETDSDLVPAVKFFSPRFVQFHSALLAEIAAASEATQQAVEDAGAEDGR